MGSDDKESPWRILALSLRGASHEKADLPCQDSHGFQVLTGGLVVAALADGAGSAVYAEVGAEIVVTKAVEELSSKLVELPAPDDTGCKSLLTQAVQASVEAIQAEADRRGVSPYDLATTLILLVAAPTFVAAAQVGDGAVIVSDGTESLMTLTKPQSGEYINETVFLVSPNALDDMQVNIYRGEVKYLAAFTDGLQSLALKLPEAAPHAPFFTPLFRFVEGVTDEAQAKEQLAAFLSSPRIRERTDDDITLLLATILG